MVKSFSIIILNCTIIYYLNELTLKKKMFKEKKLFVGCPGQNLLRLVYLPRFFSCSEFRLDLFFSLGCVDLSGFMTKAITKASQEAVLQVIFLIPNGNFRLKMQEVHSRCCVVLVYAIQAIENLEDHLIRPCRTHLAQVREMQ